MKLLIDTCNVLHRTGVLPPELAGIDEGGLAELVQKSRYRGLKADFMCDGPRIGEDGRVRAGEVPSCRFQFAGRHHTADTLIIRSLQASSSPRRILVVTSDRRIQVEARKRRCRVLDADDFLEQLAEDATRRDRGRGGPIGDDLPRSTHYWLKEFGVSHTEEASIEPPPSPEQEDATRESEPPAPPDASPAPLVPEPLEDTVEDSPAEQARWQRLMAEADRLWRTHEEDRDHPA